MTDTTRRATVIGLAVTAVLAVSVFLAQVALAGEGNFFFVFDGKATEDVTLQLTLEWKKGDETRSKTVQVPVKKGDKDSKVAETATEKLNADKDVSKDWEFKKSSSWGYHFSSGTKKAEDVNAENVGVSPVKGLSVCGGIDPPGEEIDCDADGVSDSIDNCLATPNTDQHDIDSDGRGDVCDSCPTQPAPLESDGCPVSVAVGGIAESLPAEPGSSPVTSEDSGSSAPLYGAIAGGAGLMVVALGGAGWYARRRWLR